MADAMYTDDKVDDGLILHHHRGMSVKLRINASGDGAHCASIERKKVCQGMRKLSR